MDGRTFLAQAKRAIVTERQRGSAGEAINLREDGSLPHADTGGGDVRCRGPAECDDRGLGRHLQFQAAHDGSITACGHTDPRKYYGPPGFHDQCAFV